MYARFTSIFHFKKCIWMYEYTQRRTWNTALQEVALYCIIDNLLLWLIILSSKKLLCNSENTHHASVYSWINVILKRYKYLLLFSYVFYSLYYLLLLGTILISFNDMIQCTIRCHVVLNTTTLESINVCVIKECLSSWKF